MEPNQDVQKIIKENEELKNYVQRDLRLNDKINGVYTKLDKVNENVTSLIKCVSSLSEKHISLKENHREQKEKVATLEKGYIRQTKEFRDMINGTNKVLVKLEKSNLMLANEIKNTQKDVATAKQPFQLIHRIAVGVAIIVIAAYVVYDNGWNSPAPKAEQVHTTAADTSLAKVTPEEAINSID